VPPGVASLGADPCDLCLKLGLVASSDVQYIFGSTPTDLETKRLDRLEQVLDPHTFERLDRLGVPRGSRCLEVGAGRGTSALFLLTRCGANGEVVATDIDTRWIEQIRHPNFRAVRHDILADPVEDLGLFDLIHVRYLLGNIGAERGQDVVQRLAGRLAPGGRILIEEPQVALAADPSHAHSDAWKRLVQHWDDFTVRLGLDTNFGVRLPRLLLSVGLDSIGSDIQGSVTHGGDTWSDWALTSLESAKNAVAQAFDDGGARIRALIADESFWKVYWLSAATWGSRPTPEHTTS